MYISIQYDVRLIVLSKYRNKPIENNFRVIGGQFFPLFHPSNEFSFWNIWCILHTSSLFFAWLWGCIQHPHHHTRQWPAWLLDHILPGRASASGFTISNSKLATSIFSSTGMLATTRITGIIKKRRRKLILNFFLKSKIKALLVREAPCKDFRCSTGILP